MASFLILFAICSISDYTCARMDYFSFNPWKLLIEGK